MEVRGQKTLLDFHVAALYGVETKRVNEAVRNNPRKFPEGYVFELTKEESAVLRSKISTIEQSAATLETLRSNNSTLEPVTGRGRYSKYNFKAYSETSAQRRFEEIVSTIINLYNPWALPHTLWCLSMVIDYKGLSLCASR